MDDESAEIFRRCRDGDESAADEVFHRYVERLTALARTRLSPKLASRTDPEDIVMSAYRSFFVGMECGRFEWRRSGDLWRLLVTIVLRKLYRHVERHTAEMRSVDLERNGNDWSGEMALALSREPSPEEAAALADELEDILSGLSPDLRRVLELRLQDVPIAEIAVELGRSERTVRRMLNSLEERMSQRLEEGGQPFGRIDRESRQESQEDPQRILVRSQAPSRAGKVAVARDPRAPLADSDFLLERHLGSGGIGKVYRAFQRSLERRVAVKFLKKRYSNDPGAVARFLEEAKHIARLRHPGIVAVHGIGQASRGGYFIVMDLIEGRDLSKVVTHRLPEPRNAVRWVMEAASALAHAHSRDVIHCDIKPSNLLLDGDGRIWVTDFGFAQRLVDEAGVARGLGGTAAYMAPEQLDPGWGELGPWTDVYGLGGVLYSLLTGRPPHSGERISEICSRVLSAAPVHFAEGDSVFPALRQICLKALAKRPEDRYASAAEFGAQLLR